jgi:hypothetical protein
MRMLGRFTMEAVQRILRIPQQHCVMVMSGSLNASIKGLYICVGQRCQGCGDAEISATAKGVLSDGNPMTCVSKGYLPQHPVGLFLTVVSGMLHHVVSWKLTDVSEVLSASSP